MLLYMLLHVIGPAGHARGGAPLRQLLCAASTGVQAAAAPVLPAQRAAGQPSLPGAHPQVQGPGLPGGGRPIRPGRPRHRTPCPLLAAAASCATVTCTLFAPKPPAPHLTPPHPPPPPPTPNPPPTPTAPTHPPPLPPHTHTHACQPAHSAPGPSRPPCLQRRGLPPAV